jgi:hypothetical protein
MNHRVRVCIDGVETVLTFARLSSDRRGWEYLSPGNASLHSFPEPLTPGQVFRTSGHHYEVLS